LILREIFLDREGLFYTIALQPKISPIVLGKMIMEDRQ